MFPFSVHKKPFIVNISENDYYAYWYKLADTLTSVAGFFGPFPYIEDLDFGKKELDAAIELVYANLPNLDDEILQEKMRLLVEKIRPIQEAHFKMIQDVITQLGISDPRSPSGKRLMTIRWRKLISGDAKTEQMRQAQSSIQMYYRWLESKVEEIPLIKKQFQQRILELHPDVAEKIKNP
jgi:hypothetical protein